MTTRQPSTVLYAAQALLSHRDHTVAELRRKLARKGFAPEVIEQALQQLQRHKLLDDTRTATLLVTQTLRQKAVGPRWLRQKLRQKGIADELAQTAVAAAFAQESELAVAQRAVTQWRARHVTQVSSSLRLMRHLLSRGFSSDVVRQVVTESDDY